MLTDPIKNFVDVFSKLPSLGPRQATRLAFYIASLGKNKVKEISAAIAGLTDLTTCSRCFRTHTGSGKLCSVCSDPTRNQNSELEPEQKLRLSALKNFIKKELSGRAEEIILATNPTVYGDLNAATLK